MSSTEMNPFETCEQDDYNVDGNTVAELARIGASGDAVTSKVGATYLRVLVARAQTELGAMSGYEADTQEKALNLANDAFYPHVLRGITTADCADDTSFSRPERSRRSLERNRRSNFARTAASTVRTWISVGGQLQHLDAPHVSKSVLIEEIKTARAHARDSGETVSYAEVEDISSSAALNDVERALSRTFKRMVRNLSAIKATSPERAAALAERIAAGIITSYGAK